MGSGTRATPADPLHHACYAPAMRGTCIVGLAALLSWIGCQREPQSEGKLPTEEPERTTPSATPAEALAQWLGAPPTGRARLLLETRFEGPDGERDKRRERRTLSVDGATVSTETQRTNADGRFEPAWRSAVRLRGDGAFRETYVFSNGEDYTTVGDAQPTLPWPLVKGAAREYAVTYTNGESAHGKVEVLRVGFTDRVDGQTLGPCAEVRAVDFHRARDGKAIDTDSAITFCRGFGRVRQTTTTADGWTVITTAAERAVMGGAAE